MSHGKVYGVYFSPTHTTQKVTVGCVEGLSRELGLEKAYMDITLPDRRREAALRLGEEDILVLGFPVYAGRMPLLLEDVLCRLQGCGGKTPAVIIGIYGNRDYDDALREAADRMTGQGFRVAAAAAFIGEHSLTPKVGTHRPDGEDMAKAAVFSGLVAQKLKGRPDSAVAVKGNYPYKERKPAQPVAPKTRTVCTACGRCARHCPMGIISPENPFVVGEGCLHCCACVKGCPVQAKYFDQESIQKVVTMLETTCTARREPEWFL